MLVLAWLAVAVVLGRWAGSAHRQRRLAEQVEHWGGYVTYDRDAAGDSAAWTATWAGIDRRDWFQTVVQVYLQGPEIGDEHLARIGNLTELRLVVLERTSVTSGAVASFRRAHPHCFVSR